MTQLNENMYKDLEPIYIIAYPKSGSTWVKRLFSNILNSPAGHISQQKPVYEMDENIHRKGKYKILHSHYSQKDKPYIIDENSKIIYIVRDFRDVVVSSFFHHYRINDNLVLLKKPNDLNTITSIRRVFWRGVVFNIEIAKLSRYWASISGGTSYFGVLKNFLTMRWLLDLKGSGVGRWDNHVMYWKTFSDNVAVIRYEDMLAARFFNCVV